MVAKPVAAGKSSIDHVDRDIAFSHIIRDGAGTYLDLACGAGRYSLALAERLEGRLAEAGTIHALDLWAEGVAALGDQARQLGLPIRAQVADITKPLPLADASVDVCFMATVLHDLPEAARGPLMDEVRRVLTPSGAFVLIEFKKLDQGPGPRRDHRIGPEDAAALAAAHGYRADVTASLGEFTYLSRFLAS